MNTFRLPRLNIVLTALLLCASFCSPAPAAALSSGVAAALSGSVTQVSAAELYTCALKSDSTVACWGMDFHGETIPLPPYSGLTQVSAGGFHTCVLANTSALYCWGDSFYDFGPGQPNSGYTQVSAGGLYTCALKSDSSIACWDRIFSSKPFPPPAPNTGFTQVSAGRGHICAVKNNGSIACWGDNSSGQAPPPNANSGFTQVGAGDNHTCALTTGGAIACWGDNYFGQLALPNPNSGFTQISVGWSHTCALKSNGAIACWGDNDSGQSTPPSPNSGFTQVSAGRFHTCGLKNDGAFTCWGASTMSPLYLSPALPAAIPYGDSYSQVITAGGGPVGAPYTFEVIAGALPPGLALSSTGTLSGTPTQAGNYSFTLRVLDALRYMSTRAYTLEVSRAPLNITANAAAREYGDANPGFTATYLGVKNNDPISATFTTPASPTSPVGPYAIVPAVNGAPAVLANYTITTTNGTLTVTKAPLTVKAADLTRPYGSDNPPLTYAFSTFKNGEGPGVVSGTPLLETDALPLSRPGAYEIRITPGSLAADNYAITYAPGTLRIEGMQVFLPAVQR